VAMVLEGLAATLDAAGHGDEAGEMSTRAGDIRALLGTQ